MVVQSVSKETHIYVAVHLGINMADTLSFTAKVDMSKMRGGIVHHKSDHKSCVLPTADRNNLIPNFVMARGVHSSKRNFNFPIYITDRVNF